MKVGAPIGARREEILSLAAKYGGRGVWLFGSVARGEAGERLRDTMEAISRIDRTAKHGSPCSAVVCQFAI